MDNNTLFYCIVLGTILAGFMLAMIEAQKK
jgi:hypothetical protein